MIVALQSKQHCNDSLSLSGLLGLSGPSTAHLLWFKNYGDQPPGGYLAAAVMSETGLCKVLLSC